jgi:hypothetical protein
MAGKSEHRVQPLQLLEFIQQLKQDTLNPEHSYNELTTLAELLVGGLPEYLPGFLQELLDGVAHGSTANDSSRLLYVWITFEQQCLAEDGEVRKMFVNDHLEWPLTMAAYNSLDTEAKHALQFLGCAMGTLRRHDIFFTKQSLIGLAPPRTIVGDECLVVQGCLEPFIARHVPKSTEFLLVGPCYLHGVMNGETYGSGAIDNAEWLAFI